MAITFISHATPDKEVAEKILGYLEERGIDCWMAPRDVRPGHEYAAEIMRGISECPVMVLILSEHANASLFVKREIERGVSQGKPVFPIRVREVMPSQSLELFISSQHWIDAWKPPLEQYLGRLVEAIQAVVGDDAQTGSVARPIRPLASGGRKGGSAARYLGVGLSAAIVLGVMAWGTLRLAPGILDRGTARQATPTQASDGASAGTIESVDPVLPEQTVTAAESTGGSGTGAEATAIAGTIPGEAVPEALSPVEQATGSTRTEVAAGGMSFDRVAAVLEAKSGGQRYRTIELLADEMPSALSADQVLAIVESSAYRLPAIELLKGRLPETLPYDDIMKIVGPVSGGERYNTIKAFADRMPQNLTTDKALAIVDSSAYRLRAIGFLKDRLGDTLAYDDIMKLVGPVSGGERYNTIKEFAERMPQSLTTDQALAIVDSSAYRLRAIELLKERLPETLAYEDVMKLVGPVDGGERYNTIKAFADRIAGNLTSEQIEAIIATSSYSDDARAMLMRRREQG